MKNIRQQIDVWAQDLGFQQLGVTDTQLVEAEQKFNAWIALNHHGEMSYMSRHGLKRSRPELLEPGTLRVISVRMDYFPEFQEQAELQLTQLDKGYVSRYALGRDYHKLMRKRLQKLAQKIDAQVKGYHYRAYVDSAPVLEKPLAEKAGLGWIGKHTNLINSRAGSWFFLGEIYTNIPLAIDAQQTNQAHCGHCTACLDACPTQAIIAPYQVDARRCISYLTIELKGSIPVKYRHAIGNRIYGCDDCQLVCPWNKFSSISSEMDYQSRYQLDNSSLISLFNWTEEQFLSRFQGSAIRRIGYQSWLRNISIALGNLLAKDKQNEQIIKLLKQRLHNANEILTEHFQWALNQAK